MRIIRDPATGAVTKLTFLRPSNFHAHLRLGHVLQAIAYDLMWAFKYLLVMPNDGVIDSVEKITKRHDELRALAERLGVNPTFIMTVYLTKNVTPQVIELLVRLPFRVEVKYYPPSAGATTGSGFGIPLLEAKETLRAMASYGMPLLGHFESVEDAQGRVLPHDQRETYFMREEFPRLRDRHPGLLISIEHGSTAEAVARVIEEQNGQTVITFTPHHLLLSIEEIRKLSWGNHAKCMPIPKGPEDVAACRLFATSGDHRAIAGDDTAAHLSKTKAGTFEDAHNGAFWTAHSIAAYAVAFEKERALDGQFENFMSKNGARWRRLPPPGDDETITLVRDSVEDIPEPINVPEENDRIIPIGWSLQSDRWHLGLRAVQ